MLTLAGCGLHPYPPLFSVPGAKQRRRQASRDGEYERERELVHEKETEREGGGALFLRSVISQKGFYSLFLTIFPFYEPALVPELFK